MPYTIPETPLSPPLSNLNCTTIFRLRCATSIRKFNRYNQTEMFPIRGQRKLPSCASAHSADGAGPRAT